MVVREWNPKGIEGRIVHLQRLVRQSLHDAPVSRQLALAITHGCPWRDDRCELEAIWWFMHRNIRYTGDIAGYDTFQTARRTLQFRGGDCLPRGTLLLAEGYRLVAIEDLVAGTRIWGRDRWSTVEALWFKGLLPVDAIKLNNGSWIKATADHHVFVLRCPTHQEADKCTCPPDKRVEDRILVSELQPGMMMLTPERLPFGTEKADPDRAYVEGLYLADGWTSHDFDFDIAGRDGKPKEAQKREVRAICERLGVATTWFEKSIRVRDTEWARRVQQMGERASEKHALSINLDEGAAAAILRGIMADSGANTQGLGRTFTTTSRQLAIQTRLLHKMFGISCGETYIEDHGGLGKNPIWRLFVRGQRPDRLYRKFLRVAEIHREVAICGVYDLTTDDHYVYLPEADVTVSQCDDGFTLIVTLAMGNGFPAKGRITANGGGWQHIYPLIGFPKNRPNRWVPLDWTLGWNRFGAHPPQTRFVEFDGHQVSHNREITHDNYMGW
jgi:hypothetical protein